jgi:excisionase family DNA binding protein
LAPISEGAARYAIHPKTLRRMIARGAITGYRLPGVRAVRVDLDELDTLVRAIPTVGTIGPDAA